MTLTIKRKRLELLCLVFLLFFLFSGFVLADWPQFRKDASRSGYTPENLPEEISLHWVYQAMHAPAPAWLGEDTRMSFDHAYHTVASNGILYFGSSVDCKVYALDAVTGKELWTFFTDAPVRFAPTLWNDTVFVISDDGLLYALSAETGEILWKHSGGPENEMVLGNNRMVSKWPVRGAPVSADDILYYAAGIWPSEGIFIYALNPTNGEVIWRNTDSGTIEWDQPHVTARALSGVSAQGFLAVADNNLILPTGRGVPATFSRDEGELRYFHLQRYGKAGGADITAVADHFINRGHLFDAETGDLQGRLALSEEAVAAAGNLIIYADGKNLSARRIVERESFDRMGKPITIKRMEPALLWPDERNWLIEGRSGKALGLDGKSDYLALMSPWAGEPNTFSAWVRVSKDEPDSLRVGAIAANYPEPYAINWEVHQHGKPRIYWNRGELDWRADADFRTGEWEHMVFVRDKAADKIFLYWNGKLADTHEGAGSDIPSETSFFIGADKRSEGIPYFKGDIDELAIFSRSLNADEVAILYSQGVNSLNEAVREDLVFHMPVDGTKEGDTIVADHSGMTNHAIYQRDGTFEAPHSVSALIIAGDSIVLGGPGQVSVIVKGDSDGTIKWNSSVEGTVRGMAFADGRLYASTDNGAIYCFGPGNVENPITHTPIADESVYDLDSIYANAAKEIVARTGVTKGYAVDLGCGDGSLAFWLAKYSNLHIIAIDSDIENVNTARRKLDAAGIYGLRVTVHHGDLSNTPYPNYFADLVVSGRSIAEEISSPTDEMLRLQRPYGGMLCVGKPEKMTMNVRGELEGAGNWTHQYSSPAATGISDDILTRSPLGMLWYTDYADMPIPDRHGRAPAPLFTEGRLFVMGMDALYAIDAYNGRLLWEYPFENILKPYDQEHLLGAAITGSVFCIGDESLYIKVENKCVRLDTVTGKKIGEFPAAVQDDKEQRTWGFIAYDSGILFGTSANSEHIVPWAYRASDMQELFSESDALFAINPETGEHLWTYNAKHSIRHNAIVIGDGKVYLIDRPIAKLDDIRHYDRRGVPGFTPQEENLEHEPGILLALDMTSGEILWQADDDIYGTMLAYGADHDILLMSYQRTHAFVLRSEVGGRFTAFQGHDGKRLWDTAADYRARPLINGDTIYAQPSAWNLLTGEQKDFMLTRSYGCGIVAGSRNLLTFRSATLGFRDLSKEETENYGGIRPGCWINAIPVGGLVLLPDATSGCDCSYLNKAFVALQPM